jgi:ParB family chromosome partitioning protein
LSALERAEQIDEWRVLTADKVRRDYAPSGGAQPTDLGNRKVAKELGISEGAVRISGKIAGISDDAKGAAKAAGLDDNQSALLKVAAAPAETQSDRRTCWRAGGYLHPIRFQTAARACPQLRATLRPAPAPDAGRLFSGLS